LIPASLRMTTMSPTGESLVARPPRRRRTTSTVGCPCDTGSLRATLRAYTTRPGLRPLDRERTHAIVEDGMGDVAEVLPRRMSSLEGAPRRRLRWRIAAIVAAVLTLVLWRSVGAHLKAAGVLLRFADANATGFFASLGQQ